MTFSPTITHYWRATLRRKGSSMISYIVYLFGLVTLILHFTGFLARKNLQWVVLVAPVAIFTVNILDFLRII
jgi:hypothetical protein